ncbi:alpha-2-macroglobulin-like protein 1 [Pelodytes ibericus]
MQFLLLSVSLCVLSLAVEASSEALYVITIPAQMSYPSLERACVIFPYLKGMLHLRLELHRDKQTQLLAEDKIHVPNYSHCYTFQVPDVDEEKKQVWFFQLTAQGESININQTKKVLITKTKHLTFIQSDKPIYKPGQTVKFRVVTLDKNLYSREDKYPLVELQDPYKNRIGQWMDVSPIRGIADFTFPLAEELALGEYKIVIPNQSVKSFFVAEHVLKRFEVNINAPSKVAVTETLLTVEICGRYNYGKPVLGYVMISVCLKDIWSVYYDTSEESENCKMIPAQKFTFFIFQVILTFLSLTLIPSPYVAQTDSRGCVSRDIDLHLFSFSDFSQQLEISCFLTEDNTGEVEKASAQISIGNFQAMHFVDIESYYLKGIPFTGMMKVEDIRGEPLQNGTVFLEVNNNDIELDVGLRTNENGIAYFTLNTSGWDDMVSLMEEHIDIYHPGFRDYLETDKSENTAPMGKMSLTEDNKQTLHSPPFKWLSPFYSESNSSVKVETIANKLPCDTKQPIRVDYAINRRKLDPESDQLSFFYLVLSKGGITSQNEHKLNFAKQPRSPTLQGSFSLTIPVTADLFPEAIILVFTVFPDGEIAAGRAKYAIPACVRNKVNLEFSEKKVRPGRKVTLGIRAQSGSLCSIRAVDKGVLLHQSHKRKTLPSTLLDIMAWMTKLNSRGFPFIIEDFELYPCLESDSQSMLGHNSIWYQSDTDAYSLFKESGLKILTNLRIREPVLCLSPEYTMRSFIKKQEETELTDTFSDSLSEEDLEKPQMRSFFPDTWLYDLVSIGPQEHTVMNLTAPDSITTWQADAFCLGKSGFGEIHDVGFITFKPYFVDLALPYMVIQGEEFTLIAVIFSYLKHCLMVVASLSDSLDFTIVQTTNKQHNCICEDQNARFTWNITATKLGTFKLQVRSSALKQDGGCNRNEFELKKKYKTDIVTKSIVVKPRGILKEETQTFLLCPSGDAVQDEVALTVPQNLEPGSEHAHITVLGNVIGNAIHNVGQSLKLPVGCGEQNMVNFAPNIHLLQYLQSTKQLSSELRSKALEYLTTGYQRQLKFKHNNGAYSAFEKDSEGNTWLTAFVLRSFSQAREFIYIEEKHIQQAVQWLSSLQLPNGCFQSVGALFNNRLKSEINDVTFAAYITIALLESGTSYNCSTVERALRCLKNEANKVHNTYSQVLLAYAFTLSKDSDLRQHMLDVLEKKAIRKGGSKHWALDSHDSGGVEMSSYVLLALLSDKAMSNKNIAEASNIANWLIKQQNPWGGFFSTQDTVVALQALSKYAKSTFTDTLDVKVKVRSRSGFQKQFIVDKFKSLLQQRETLPYIPGKYTVTATGRGCVYVQTHLKYHVPPAKSNSHFSLRVTTEPTVCTQEAQRSFEIIVEVRYTGNRISSNMVIVEVELLSGFKVNMGSVTKLELNPLIKRTEITAEKMIIYLDELKHVSEMFSFSVKQESPVKNLQPANTLVYDYYDPDEHAETEYNSPCRTGTVQYLSLCILYSSPLCVDFHVRIKKYLATLQDDSCNQ